MFRVVKFGHYVIVHAICHVSLNVRIKRKKKKDNSESLGHLWL